MSNICIVGAGPAGLLLGTRLARKNHQVQILEREERSAYTGMHNWSDALEVDILRDAGLPVPRMDGDRFRGPGVKGDEEPGLYERHRVSQLAVFSPDYSQHAVVDADFRHVLVDRHRLRDYQLTQAEEAGVAIHCGCRVTGLLGRLEGSLEEIRVTGVLYQAEGRENVLQADLVVDATGQAAVLRQMLGAPEIARPFNRSEYGYVYRTVRRFDPARVGESRIPFVEHYRLRSDRGYLFVHFHAEDIIDIGGGARAPVPDGMARQTVEDTQINPTQGCGIASGYAGALLAAEAIVAAGDYDLENLWAYNHRWFTGRGAHYAALYQKMKGISGYNVEELCYLLRQNIMNGEALTNDYHGRFVPLNMDEGRRQRAARRDRPEVADCWTDSYAAGQAVWDHYRTYPREWDRQGFMAWVRNNPVSV